MFANLLAAQAVGLEVLPRVAPNLGRAVLLDLNLVTEFSEANGELRAVHGGGELLRPKQLLWLQGAKLAVLGPRHVEEHRVGMELRSWIAVDGTSGVVLELCDDPIASCLRRPIATDAC